MEADCSIQDAEIQTLQKVLELLQLNDEQVEQLKWNMLGEKVDIKYRFKTNGQEVIALPTEMFTTNAKMKKEN